MSNITQSREYHMKYSVCLCNDLCTGHRVDHGVIVATAALCITTNTAAILLLLMYDTTIVMVLLCVFNEFTVINSIIQEAYANTDTSLM